MGQPFQLSPELMVRRQQRDIRDGFVRLPHRTGHCGRRDDGMCHECYRDVLAEIADYIDLQRPRQAAERAHDYYTAVGGPAREGWLDAVAYIDGLDFALRAVAEARACRLAPVQRSEFACST